MKDSSKPPTRSSKGLDIGMVWASMGRSEPAVVRGVVDVSTLPQTMMAHFFIEQLNSRKARSGIIILSSITGMEITGQIAIYSSTKAFKRFLTSSLYRMGRYPKIISSAWFCLLPVHRWLKAVTDPQA